jgi:hypothetical protein
MGGQKGNLMKGLRDSERRWFRVVHFRLEKKVSMVQTHPCVQKMARCRVRIVLRLDVTLLVTNNNPGHIKTIFSPRLPPCLLSSITGLHL